MPHFAVAGAARAVDVMLGHDAIEVLADLPVARVASQLVSARGADHLGNIRVGVIAVELVLIRSQRIEDLVVLEAIPKVAIFRVAGNRVEVECGLHHAAVLDQQHMLPVVVGEAARVSVGPVRHVRRHVERLPISGVLVHVDQPGHDLVVGVERRPHSLVFPQPLVEVGRIRAQISILRLAGGQHRHQLVRFGDDERVSRAGMHQRARGQIVSDIVAAQLAVRSFPSAQRIGIGGDACRDPEIVRQPLVGQGIEEAAIQLHRVLPKARQQPNLGHGKRLCLPLDLCDWGLGQALVRRVLGNVLRNGGDLFVALLGQCARRTRQERCRRGNGRSAEESSARQSAIHRFHLI